MTPREHAAEAGLPAERHGARDRARRVREVQDLALAAVPELQKRAEDREHEHGRGEQVRRDGAQKEPLVHRLEVHRDRLLERGEVHGLGDEREVHRLRVDGSAGERGGGCVGRHT